MNTNKKSEVAQLMEQISVQHESARLALNGLAYGTAMHEFITRRMERIASCSVQLMKLVGDEEGILLLSEAMDKVPTPADTPQP